VRRAHAAQHPEEGGGFHRRGGTWDGGGGRFQLRTFGARPCRAPRRGSRAPAAMKPRYQRSADVAALNRHGSIRGLRQARHLGGDVRPPLRRRVAASGPSQVGESRAARRCARGSPRQPPQVPATQATPGSQWQTPPQVSLTSHAFAGKPLSLTWTGMRRAPMRSRSWRRRCSHFLESPGSTDFPVFLGFRFAFSAMGERRAAARRSLSS
jgi:hypothetical protein